MTGEQTLRRAAGLMRERAEAAEADSAIWTADVTTLLEVGDDTFAHAASWHPAVALAVADWLDEVHANVSTYNSHYHRHAFAVARAYLGEEA